MSSRMRGSPPSHTHYARMIEDLFWSETAANHTLNIAGRVWAVPIDIHFILTISKIGFVVQTQAGNLRVGIYRDNGNTPVGEALLRESASVACGAAGSKQELDLTATIQLAPGLYWLAVQSSTTTCVLYRGAGGFYVGGTLNGKRWDNVGGYAAFENPQASVVTSNEAAPNLFVLVSSIP